VIESNILFLETNDLMYEKYAAQAEKLLSSAFNVCSIQEAIDCYV